MIRLKYHTPGVFKHLRRPVWFTLTVDDFGIKYIGKHTILHLIKVLKSHYDMDTGWTGGLYCDVTLEWNHEQRYVDISIPNTVRKKLIEYEHIVPTRVQLCPYQPHPINYGKNSDKNHTSGRISTSQRRRNLVHYL